jgi:hypothetical protein
MHGSGKASPFLSAQAARASKDPAARLLQHQQISDRGNLRWYHGDHGTHKQINYHGDHGTEKQINT